MACFYRCRMCRRGLMTPERMDGALAGCRHCGSRQWVPVRHLTWADRVRLPQETGLPPWTRVDVDPEW